MSVSASSSASPSLLRERQARILWRCRRGIREMDLLLQHFVRYHFDVLSEQDKQNFEVLLNESDLDIMAWISGLRPCPCPQYTPLIKLLSEFQR